MSLSALQPIRYLITTDLQPGFPRHRVISSLQVESVKPLPLEQRSFFLSALYDRLPLDFTGNYPPCFKYWLNFAGNQN
jgi:hypothetical protein